MELWLVADTNLFFECKPLAQLPWSELGHDPIILLLSKPVLDEIDKHKKGSGRTRERALDIFGSVRTMLTTNEQVIEIRAASPRVVMRLENARPDPRLKDDLDYSRTDEKLVGIVSTLQSGATAHIVKLFTDDTGPSSTASGLGLPFQMIDASWRRPPSESTESKKIKELEKDLSTYRAQEPRIAIGPCADANSSNVVEVTRRVASPLTEDEIEEIISSLRVKHPMKEFIPPPPSTRTDAKGESVRIEYLAPPEEAIDQYRNELYPRWIETCRGILRALHEGRDVEAPPLFVRWPMTNVGTRPATQVRIEFEAKGPLKILQIQDDSVEDESVQNGSEETKQSRPVACPTFPSPPQSPAFQQKAIRTPAPLTARPTATLVPVGVSSAFLSKTAWQDFAGASRTFRDLEKMGVLGRATNLDNALAQASRLFSSAPSFDPAHVSVARAMMIPDPVSIPNLGKLLSTKRDPETFYYADWPTNEAVKKGALTCSLWRHQRDEELFEFEVVFEQGGEARGAIECTVHADNLTKPEQARAIVTRAIEHFSMREIADAMVKTCR